MPLFIPNRTGYTLIIKLRTPIGTGILIITFMHYLVSDTYMSFLASEALIDHLIYRLLFGSRFKALELRSQKSYLKGWRSEQMIPE